jgi:hypothetical protein
VAGDRPAHLEHNRRNRYSLCRSLPQHFLTFLALGILTVAETGHYITSGGDPNAFVDYARPYFSMCLVTTLLATTLIVFRILWLTRDNTGTGTAFSGYRAVVEMVVESALLYSATLVVYIILLFGADSSNNDGYAQAILIQMTVRLLFSPPS